MKKEVQKAILEYIFIKKSVTTLELCDKFLLSESSCRRELHRLDKLGAIERYHGGALCIQNLQENRSITQRFCINEEEKEAIAKCAARLIAPNDTIIMLGGTTVFRMCKYIQNKNLTIITNSIIVFQELCNRKNIHLILLGGEYKKDEAELSGVLTITNSKVFVCNHVFMGISGYIKNTGFTTADMTSIELYSWCIKMANQVNVLCDHTKFENKGLAITAHLSDINNVVSDDKIDHNIKQELESKGIHVIVGKTIGEENEESAS